MREHMGLYRGKRIDNGEWAQGYYMCLGGKYHYILVGKLDITNGYPDLIKCPVDPDTVGECTGLSDKNGKLIFEGDVFRMDYDLISVVIFKDGCFRLQIYGLCGTYTESGYDECGGGWGIVECDPIDWYYIHDMEIASNIHDNPELLKGGGTDE